MPVTRQIPSESHKAGRYFKIGLIVGILLLLNYAGSLMVKYIDIELWPKHEPIIVTLLWFSIIAYVVCMAMPFVPGIEMGIALMTMFGARGVALVYLCTLLSLSLSFAIGRLIPLKAFSRFLGWLHLRRVQDLVLQLEPLSPQEMIDFLLTATPSRVIPYLLRHRYLMIAAALNLPGNALIGGGGGIGLIAGMSRLYPYPKYFLFVALAITPLPILFLAGLLQ